MYDDSSDMTGHTCVFDDDDDMTGHGIRTFLYMTGHIEFLFGV